MTERLIYGRPQNRDLMIHTVLHALQEDNELFDRFMTDPKAVLSAFDLDDDAQRLLSDRDYQGLVERGVHPILVVQLQRRVEWGVSRYADEGGGAS